MIMWDLNLCEQEKWLAGFHHHKSPFMEFICVLDILPYGNCSTSLVQIMNLPTVHRSTWVCQKVSY